MRFGIVVPALTALALTSAGCAAFQEESASTDDGVQIAAAFYPLAYASDRVAGDLADVELLTQPGTEPHDLELTVKETAQLTLADLVVYQGGFQAAVDAATEQNATGATLDVAEVVDLLTTDEEAHDDHDGEDHDEDDGHDHGDVDPHFWLDPLRMAEVGDAVADQLAEIDPDHADEYAANAAALRDDLTALDEEYADGLASCERDTVVVSHDAFSYLEKYGVHVAAIAGLSPDAEPTPADLAELHDLIRTDGITTVFSETLAPKQLAESLARGTGVETAVLDPLEGLTEETSDEDYLSLMRTNLEALRAANGCA
ncbi:metal ABC transporter substrate-binding protein [Nocardioides sp. GY 10113]|uniref:metal ABC transporter substrate-binding protein n=1 Tax=Nocardioides sp. GY 10113 TaxID=2569761 RepID=UPI00197EDD23|nr:metal ABC transporter substrate-binding protein [Nocardioides sp. GY 10113]